MCDCRQNIIEVSVYYSEIAFEKITEVKGYDIPDFFSKFTVL